MPQKKTFKFPLKVWGTKDELSALTTELLALGYTFAPRSNRLDTMSGDRHFLLTQFVEEGIDYFNSGDKNHENTFEASTDHDIILALAAAVKESEGNKGEMYVFIGDNNYFTKGKLYQLQQNRFEDYSAFIRDDGTADGFSGTNYRYFRKATKEEIIKHFNDAEAALANELVAITEQFLGKKKFGLSIAEILEAAGGHDVDFNEVKSYIVSEEPQEVTVPARVSFIKELYEGVDDEVQEAFEKEFPTLFKQRPTFKVGDRLAFFPSCKELLIIGTNSTDPEFVNEIGLVELPTGLVQSSPVPVCDIHNISERQLIQAGEDIGLTRCNYAKFTS